MGAPLETVGFSDPLDSVRQALAQGVGVFVDVLVSTSVSVARAAAIDSALANRVPPVATCSAQDAERSGSSTAATAPVIPYAPSGMPLEIALPRTTKSG